MSCQEKMNICFVRRTKVDELFFYLYRVILRLTQSGFKNILTAFGKKRKVVLFKTLLI